MKECTKNQNCHSERSEESHVFLSFQKNVKKLDPSAFGLRMTREGELTKILDHPQYFMKGGNLS